MRISKLHSVILIMILVSMTSIPTGTSKVADINVQDSGYIISDQVDDVPYVWQEVNGFCLPSAMSMVFQSMGRDLSLYDILASSGAGFSMISLSIGESMTFFPGVLIRQLQWLEFFTEIQGIEMEVYLDSSTAYGWNAKQMLVGLGFTVTDYAESELLTPLGVMQDTIDAGYPLAISVDTFYLPPVDWDIIRNYVGPLEVGGVGHAIVIVGYNDTSQTVRVHDPGVGLLEPYVGYPDDGRWNYTMSYTMLDNAWSSAGHVTFRLANGTGRVSDFEDRLASYISKRLIGNRTSYFEGFENFFYLSTGADAYRGMGLDMSLEAIRDYCTYYLEVNKPTAIRMLGHGLETMMTIQYMAYRGSLESLPELLPSFDLQDFIDEASKALPHMEALSSNESITSGITIKSRDTILYNTFYGMADSFEASLNLNEAISEFSDELDEIAGHLFAIANAWRASGEILVDMVDSNSALPNSNLFVIVGGSAVLIVGVVFVFWRRRK
ncbi:MAG: C39 family peptidase [Candidatus Thorarchaeota archaeon]